MFVQHRDTAPDLVNHHIIDQYHQRGKTPAGFMGFTPEAEEVQKNIAMPTGDNFSQNELITQANRLNPRHNLATPGPYPVD